MIDENHRVDIGAHWELLLLSGWGSVIHHITQDMNSEQGLQYSSTSPKYWWNWIFGGNGTEKQELYHHEQCIQKEARLT